jgi:hypothetical protein
MTSRCCGSSPNVNLLLRQELADQGTPGEVRTNGKNEGGPRPCVGCRGNQQLDEFVDIACMPAVLLVLLGRCHGVQLLSLIDVDEQSRV